MAEKDTKAKAPAKATKTPAKKATGTATKASPAKKATAGKAKPAPTHAEIAALARKFWEEGGHREGHAQQDWERAEKQLRGK